MWKEYLEFIREKINGLGRRWVEDMKTRFIKEGV